MAASSGAASLCSPSGSTSVTANQQIIVAKKKKLSEQEIAEHPLLPQRDGVDEKEFGGEIKWRSKKGDYTKANAKYLNERIGRWNSPDCLENVVSNLVKTLEMELTKKIDPQQWISMAPDVFRYRANGHEWVDTEQSMKEGSYNIMMKGSDKALYDTTLGYDESHDVFLEAMPGGFALEILKVYGGPPEVGFTWRHWGKFEGEFNGRKGDGRDINIFGFATAKVLLPDDKNHRIRVTEFEVYYDLDKFLADLNMKDTDPTTTDTGMGGTIVKV